VAQATGLDLTTPTSFLEAISGGHGPDTSDKVTVDDQIENRRIAVFIEQPERHARRAATVRKAHDNNIPVVSVLRHRSAGVNFQMAERNCNSSQTHSPRPG
jgi:hypothetical protein